MLPANVSFAAGCQQPRCQRYSRAEVEEAVRGADVVLVCLGTGKGGSRGHGRSPWGGHTGCKGISLDFWRRDRRGDGGEGPEGFGAARPPAGAAAGRRAGRWGSAGAGGCPRGRTRKKDPAPCSRVPRVPHPVELTWHGAGGDTPRPRSRRAPPHPAALQRGAPERELGAGTRWCGGHPGLLLPRPGHRAGHHQGPAGRAGGQPRRQAAGHVASGHAPGKGRASSAPHPSVVLGRGGGCGVPPPAFTQCPPLPAGAPHGELHHGGADVPLLRAGGPALPLWVRAVLHHLPVPGPGAEPPAAARLRQPLRVRGAGEHGAAGRRGGERGSPKRHG